MKHKVPLVTEAEKLLPVRSFDLQDPDEGRLLRDAFGAGLWEEDLG